MKGKLNEILPEPISEANEKAVLDLLRRKVRGAASLSVRLLRAMEEKFGAPARAVIDEMIAGMKPASRPDAGDPQRDLHDFCDRMERGCVGSHLWERVIDEPDRVAYRFTRCLWAEVYRELGEPDLGFIMCAADEPGVRSYNPHLGFQRTKVLMHGDELCDHVFSVEKSSG